MRQFGHLYVVNEDHVDMMHMYDAVRDIVRVNQPGPQLYLRPIYAYYSAVLSDRIKLLTERIFEQSILPGLPVCASFHCHWMIIMCSSTFEVAKLIIFIQLVVHKNG